MANVKRRLNAPKSAPKPEPKRKWPDDRTKKGLRSLQPVEVKSTDNNRSRETNTGVAKKRVANDNFLFTTPAKKAKYSLQKGLILKDNFDVKKPLQNDHIYNNNTKSKTGNRNKSKITKPAPKLPGLMKKTHCPLKGANKFKYLKLMDEIIKDEFGLSRRIHKSKEDIYAKTRINNNNIEITDQNNKTTEKIDKTTERTNKTIEKTDKTTEKNNKTTDKSNKTTERINKTTERTNKTTERTNKTTEKNNKIIEKINKTTEKNNKTTEKNNKTTEKNNKTTEKNNKTTEKNNKTTEKTNKTTDKTNISTAKNKSSVKNKKAVSVDVVRAPETAAPTSNQSKCNKQQTELVNFADETKPQSPPPRYRKGTLSKIYKYGKTPKTTQVVLANGVIKTLPHYECDYCKKSFSRKHSLVRHIYLHLGSKPYYCPACPKKFRIRKNMKVHLERDHDYQKVDKNTKTYSCDTCNKPFLSKEDLTLHLRSHIKGENSFKCIYCDKKFEYQLLLVQHEKKHLVTGKYQCTICDIKYDSRDKLYVHVKSHLKLADYICQFCGREFLRANSLKRHIQTMHVGSTIQCPVCDKKLKGHLTEHMRTHDKERPHKCPDCGKLFAQSTQMKVHRRGHTGSRPYLCRICDQPFSHSNALMLHVRRHTGEKPFPCAECPMSFSQLPHMKSHMFKIHGKINPYRCFKCNNYFKLKKELVFHKKSCTGAGMDIDLYGDERPITKEPRDDDPDVPVQSTMTLSRMRFLLALLLTMIASKEKLKYLGFNKRLVDDLLIESLEAMDQTPCLDGSMPALIRLRTNIEKLLHGTVPPKQMEKFKKEKKSTEELLELLTSEKDN